MNIWFDLTNSPHVQFFAHLISELQNEHHLLCTCRHLSNTVELLEFYHIPYYQIGKHYGRHPIKKMGGFIIRIIQLYRFLKDKSIDMAISHSSFYSPVVAKLLGASCIYINDNEHAAGNRIAFFCADRIMIPEFIDIEKISAQGAGEHKVIKYPGLKEGIYLWNLQSTTSGQPMSLRNGRKSIFVRPEPWTAQYYRGKKNFIDKTLADLKESFNVVILPRNKEQERYYRQPQFSGINVAQKTLSLSDILDHCDLFIGAGGTMTREAAVLGLPTISTYQGELLDVDRFLITNGHMVHEKNLSKSFVENFLEDNQKREPIDFLLRQGKKAYELIKQVMGV